MHRHHLLHHRPTRKDARCEIHRTKEHERHPQFNSQIDVYGFALTDTRQLSANLGSTSVLMHMTQSYFEVVNSEATCDIFRQTHLRSRTKLPLGTPLASRNAGVPEERGSPASRRWVITSTFVCPRPDL